VDGLRLALGALATWRVTHLLAEEDGPFDAVVRTRARLGDGQLGQLADCFYCLSIWVAAPVAGAVAPRRREAPLAWLALSGAACLLERLTDRTEGATDVLWEETQSRRDEHRAADAREPARAETPRRAAAAR